MKKYLKKITSKFLQALPYSPTWMYSTVLFFARAGNKGFRVFPKSFSYDKEGFSRLAVKSVFGFWYCGDVMDSYDIAWGIFRNGIIELEGTNLVVFLLEYFAGKKDKVVFYDIGANTGYFAILAAFLGKGKTASYGFEPVPEFFRTAEESARLNYLQKDCHLFNYALGDEDKELDIFLSGTGSSFNLPEKAAKNPEALQKVKQVRLDGLAEKKLVEDPDIVIMDVEGHEYNVLLGGSNTFSRSLPVIYYEQLFLKKGARLLDPKDTKEVAVFLQNLGYKIFACETDRLVPLKDFKPRIWIPNAVQAAYMCLALHSQKHSELIVELIKDYPSIVAKNKTRLLLTK